MPPSPKHDLLVFSGSCLGHALSTSEVLITWLLYSRFNQVQRFSSKVCNTNSKHYATRLKNLVHSNAVSCFALNLSLTWPCRIPTPSLREFFTIALATHSKWPLGNPFGSLENYPALIWIPEWREAVWELCFLPSIEYLFRSQLNFKWQFSSSSPPLTPFVSFLYSHAAWVISQISQSRQRTLTLT